MDIFDSFATSPKLEVEGAWFDLDATTGAKLLVARANNDRYLADLRTELAKHQNALDAGGKAADELAEKIMIDVASRTILLGWSNIKFKGQVVEYSPSMSKTMLGIKDFRKRVNKMADTFEAFRAKAEEEQGNA